MAWTVTSAENPLNGVIRLVLENTETGEQFKHGRDGFVGKVTPEAVADIARMAIRDREQKEPVPLGPLDVKAINDALNPPPPPEPTAEELAIAEKEAAIKEEIRKARIEAWAATNPELAKLYAADPEAVKALI